MKTRHKICFESSKKMEAVPTGSVDLVVTSPPYPMIEMWDEMFARQSRDVHAALKAETGLLAFEFMHRQLDAVWKEVGRVLKTGGLACINIGDAARTISGDFMLYPNHSRILSVMVELGFMPLPAIIWRKQTNAPNKFMGSGMLPAGAYVTLEHEYILILRKGVKREFNSASEKQRRRQSAFFWEERNLWFSDVWMDLKGTLQNMNQGPLRLRSAAFPVEVPYRLINMYSVKGDTILDPFLGTGTTTWASMASGRNSIGFEVELGFRDMMASNMDLVPAFSNQKIKDRIKSHLVFVQDRVNAGGEFKYVNEPYGFPVITKQETDLLFNELQAVEAVSTDVFEVDYSDSPRQEFTYDEAWQIARERPGPRPKKRKSSKSSEPPSQRKLF